MTQSVPLAYIRIWCNKNQCWVGFQTPQADLYRIDSRGVYLTLPDRTLSLINPRLIFPTVDRYPSLTVNDFMLPPGIKVPALNVYNNADGQLLKRVAFDQIQSEVESYLSLLTHLEPIQFYIAVRAYESGLVGLPHLNRIAGVLEGQTTLSVALLREKLCTWEDLLSVCLDIPRDGSGHVPPPDEYELIGEIMVAIGRLTRTQLQRALNMRRGGNKPLGEILLEMGVCSKVDLQHCLRTQEQLKAKSRDRLGLTGELLVEHGILSYDDLDQALRMQRIGRQPLHAVLISMGICAADQIKEFKYKFPQHVTHEGFDERALCSYLLYHRMASEKQLEEARRIQARGRLVLGELLVNLKKCQPEDIEKALQTQQSIRDAASGTSHKIGELLKEQTAVTDKAIEDAARMQELSRQKMGDTLIQLGTCTQDDFTDALDLQFNWRQLTKDADDKLGQELVKDGVIDSENLQRALDIHIRAGKPLGQILVESGSCRPESVIDTLINRDFRRRKAFRKFLRENATIIERPLHQLAEQERARAAAAAAQQPAKTGLMEKISSLFFVKREP